ncbi:MAG: ABC transporter ATP-binding protein [Spirochaetia bacterium]|nr:ABC transporter ATP-binding protein [Spirochaetia bacterium]
MVVISVNNLEKTLKDSPLFSNVTFAVEKGTRIGLIGQNGCGKSTLLKLLDGSMESDEGTISYAKDILISTLSQRIDIDEKMSVRDFLYTSIHPHITLLNRYNYLLKQKETPKSHKEILHLQHLIEEVDAWHILNRYESFLSELNGPSLDTLMGTLSGGGVKKVAVSRLFAAKNDLVFLDEITNHLDIQTIKWIENYLVSNSITAMIVTHDRYFLENVCQTIFELDGGSLYSYPGSYSTYLIRREERYAAQKAEQEKIKSILRVELKWLQRGPRARATKDSGRIDRIAALQESIVVQEAPRKDFTSLAVKSSKKIVDIENVSKWYDGKKVIDNFSHSFLPMERVGLIGENGSGKSTLLDLIAKEIECDEGTIERGFHTHIGYYDQVDALINFSTTVLDFMSDIAPLIYIEKGVSVSAAKFLELFGFPISLHRQPISLLSGGERRRLYLISILAKSPNFLLLDEPTNDLDIDTIGQLELFLSNFEGCVLIASHDRAFLDSSCDTLFIFEEDKEISKSPYSYSEWEQRGEEEKASKKDEIIKEKVDSRPKRETKGLTFKEKKELEKITDTIASLEKEIASLEASFSDPSIDPLAMRDFTMRYKESQKELEVSLLRWEYLEEKNLE